MTRRQPDSSPDPASDPNPKRTPQRRPEDVIWRAGRVQQWPIGRLRPYARNPRTHSPAQVTALAAQELGLKKVPVVVLDHLTETERRAYVIADNRLAELAGWDREILAEELCVLEGEGFPVELTGFDEHEIDKLIGEDLENEFEVAPAVEDEDTAQEKWKVQKGQLWRIGQHRLLCGDATQPSDWARMMGGEQAAMVFTDPPYGVAYQSSSVRHDAIRGDGILHPHEYKRVKAGTPGAKPAVMVAGKEIGKVIHVKVEKHSPAAAREKKKAEKPKPGSAAQVKASTERLERRRMAWQVDRALEELCGINPPEAGMLVKLAGVFGTGSLGQGSGAPGRAASLAPLQQAFVAAGTTELWAAVFTECHGLRDQLALRRRQDLDGAHAIVQWLTEELRGAPAWRMVVEASEVEIPAPKALHGLKQTTPAKRAPGGRKARL